LRGLLLREGGGRGRGGEEGRKRKGRKGKGRPPKYFGLEPPLHRPPSCILRRPASKERAGVEGGEGKGREREWERKRMGKWGKGRGWKGRG